MRNPFIGEISKESIKSFIMKTYSSFQKIIVIVLLAALLISLVIPILTAVVYGEEVDLTESEQTEIASEGRKYNSFDILKNNIVPEPVEVKEIDIDEEAVSGEDTLKGTAYPDPDTNMGKIYKYITEEMGLNRAVAFGILSHIRRESRFLPTAYNPSGYYGMCQWGGNRYTNLINWCSENGYDYTTIDGQVRFMEHELNGPYSKVLDALKECENTADGAYDAAYVFGMRYEVSGLSNARNAGYSAMEMFNHE